MSPEELTAGGLIEGTVTVEGGPRASGAGSYVWLNVVAEPGGEICARGVANVDENGFYRFDEALAPGNYEVSFNGFDNAADEFYHDATNSAESYPFSVSAGVTSVIDEELTNGGYIAGTSGFDTGGSAGGGLCVGVQHWQEGEDVDFGVTDADGAFVVGALPPGDPFRPVQPVRRMGVGVLCRRLQRRVGGAST